MKKFRVQIFAYQLRADFIIESLDEAQDLENAIIDKLGKNDIKWENLGFFDPSLNRITYEEVIDGNNISETFTNKKGLGQRWEQDHLIRVNILLDMVKN